MLATGGYCVVLQSDDGHLVTRGIVKLKGLDSFSGARGHLGLLPPRFYTRDTYYEVACTFVAIPLLALFYPIVAVVGAEQSKFLRGFKCVLFLSASPLRVRGVW